MPQQFTVIRLKIDHSIHLGSFREDYETTETMFHSDAMYAALISAWSQLGIQHKMVSNDPIDEEAEPGFCISSLFPYFVSKENSEPLYFFPVPVGGIPLRNELLKDSIKHVKWLDQEAYVSLLTTGYIKENKESIKGIFYTSRPDFDEKFMVTDLHPRVYVPRQGEKDLANNIVSDTVIFYLERLFFKEGCGLFFISQYDDEQIKEKVERALSHLQYEGLGTDRHVGHGQFTFEQGSFNHFDLLPRSEFSINISMFCPESKAQLESMINSEVTQYSILKRGGWITSEPDLSIRKDSVYMFREGSIFKGSYNVAGKSVNLRPNISELKSKHPVWRIGRSVFLPVSFNLP